MIRAVSKECNIFATSNTRNYQWQRIVRHTKLIAKHVQKPSALQTVNLNEGNNNHNGIILTYKSSITGLTVDVRRATFGCSALLGPATASFKM